MGRLGTHRRWLAGLLLVLLLGLGVSCAPAPPVSRQPGPPPVGDLLPAPEVGRLAPDFSLTDLEGNTATLSALRGKTVFLNFWATWCPPCRQEMPEIEATYQQYRE
ncbi:MAG: redoxin domain-containing protein, partial [Chloroflexota bacterium]